MLKNTQIGQEVWIIESVQCIVPPSIYIVLRGIDMRFYPFHLTEAADISYSELTSLDIDTMNFTHFVDTLSFCQDTSYP